MNLLAKGRWGRVVEQVPSVRIDFLEILAEEVSAWNRKEAERNAETVIHGSRLAGQALTFVDEEEQPGTWVIVGFTPDGRNCRDCLALHGVPMTYGVYLDTKYTTRCGGNCRCGFAAGAKRGEKIEPLTQAEFEAALDARP